MAELPVLHIAKAALFRDDKILVLTRADDDPRRPGEFDFPGGMVGDEIIDETIIEGVMREIEEETGILLEPTQLEEVDTYEEQEENQLVTRHLFIGKIAGETQVRLSLEHGSAEWLAPDNLFNKYEHRFYLQSLKKLLTSEK